MTNSYDILAQSLENIIENIPVWETSKETNQENINNALNILRNIESKTLELIKQNIISVSPNIEDNKEMIELETKLDILKQYLHWSLASQNPYEELNFNNLTYKLDNPINLNDFNSNLKLLVEKFKSMNIIIGVEDFKYSYHVTKYITKLFECIDDPNFLINMKTVFDNIYWKNHNILSDITISVRILKSNKRKIVDDFILKSKTEFIKNNNIDEKNFKKNYDNLFIQAIDKSKIMPKRIWDLFNDNKLVIDDYFEDSTSFLAHRNKFINANSYDNFSPEQKNQFHKNLEDLDLNLYEYENFETYKFLIDNVKKIIEKKATAATEVAAKNKTIDSLIEINKKNIDLINKLNIKKTKITNKKIGFGYKEKKKDKQLLDISQKIDNQILVTENNLNQLRIEYDNYDDLIFEDKVCKSFTENYTIYDVFKLYQHDLIALRKAIAKNDKEIIPEEHLTNLVNQFTRFMEDPRIKIINSINYLKIDEIDSVIEEKYKLSGIKVEISKTTDPLYKELRKSCEILTSYDYIINSGWTPLIIKSKMEYDNN